MLQEYPEGYYIASIGDEPRWLVRNPKKRNSLYIADYKGLSYLNDVFHIGGGFDKIERKLEDWEVVKYRLLGFLF